MRDPLTLLLTNDPDGLAALRARGASDRVARVDTPTGPVVSVDGRKLHSGRDPAAEARRFARGLELADATFVIVLGFASGHAIRAIAERTEAAIVVFEPDLDVLREGVTHGPVPERVRVVTTVSRLAEVLYARLSGCDRGVVARWVPSMRLDPRLYDEALVATANAIDRAGLRHRTAKMRGPGWLRHYLAHVPALASAPGLPALRGMLRGVPAVIVAAGPSLDRNAAQLAGLADRAFIMCVNTAAGALARAGVRPHALVTIESLDVSAQLRDLPFLAEVPAFVELTANDALWELPLRAKLPISVDTSSCAVFSGRIDAGHHLSAGFCVANAATSIAYVLGCDPIVLVGSDLAYSEGRVYACGTSFADMRADVQADGTAKLSGLHGKRAIEERSGDAAGGSRVPDRAKLRTLPAWGGHGTVVSTRDFAMFRDWYIHAAKTLVAEGVRTINATEGGAHIDGWEDLPLAQAIAADGPALGMAARVDTMLAAPPTDPAAVRRELARELTTAETIVRDARKALALLGDDPDGDLTLDGKAADRLLAINRNTRAALREAPLCAEAVFVPIEDLRAAGAITAHAFYAGLVEPLVALAADLARLLQHPVLATPDAKARATG